MTFSEFQQSLRADDPPAGLTPALQALWFDGRGHWARAHDVAQEIDGRDGSLVHAYLHRKEGDIGNAHYWYHRAGIGPADGSLDAEWQHIVETMLARESAGG